MHERVSAGRGAKKVNARGGVVPVSRAATPRLAMVALCAFAAILRLLHVGHGLPDFTEEAAVFRRAVEMWGADGTHFQPNPHWFVYPSLVIYLHFVIQHLVALLGGARSGADFLLGLATDPTPGVIAGRCISIAADVVTVALVGRLAAPFGRGSAVLAMSFVALSPTMIETSRLIYTDNVMTALSLAALDRLMLYVRDGGARRLTLSAALVGLAAGAKYPAFLLLVPVGVVLWIREPGRRALIGLALGLLAALTAFLLTTPFALASWPEVLRDLTFNGDVATGGELGKLHGPSFGYYFELLVRNQGWAGVVAAGSSLLGWRNESWRPLLILLWSAWVVMLAPIVSVPVEAGRYLIPAVALSSVLAAAGFGALRYALPRLRRAWTTAVLVGLVAQPAVAGFAEARSGATSTDVEARRWCGTHFVGTDLVLEEAYGPNLPSAIHKREVKSGPVYSGAGPAARAAFDSGPSFHAVWLPLLVGGRATVQTPTRGHTEVAVYPHAVDWNAAVYDVRLLGGVDYVVTTGPVRGRFEADPARFPEQMAFYSFLDKFGALVGQWSPGPGTEGPNIRVYHLTPQVRATAAASGPLDLLWWARTVPKESRDLLDRLMDADTAAGPPKWAGLPPWAAALRPAYMARYALFVDQLTTEELALERWRAAQELSRATLAILPEDMDAAMAHALSCRAAGRWGELEAGVAETRAALRPGTPLPAELYLIESDALERLGRMAEATAALEAAAVGGDDAVTQIAAERLKSLRGGRSRPGGPAK